MENIILWFIGANATGKTTQAALFHKYLQGKKRHFGLSYKDGTTEGGVKWKYTICSEMSSNLGRMNHPLLVPNGDKALDCCGTDTLSTKVQIMESLKRAKKASSIVVVDGIMATGQWIEFLKDESTHVCLIFCDIDIDTCLKRLKKRRAQKLGVSIFDVDEFTEKTVENITGKVNGFRSLWLRMYDQCDSRLKIDSNQFDKHQINEQIIDYFENHILQII